MRRPRIGITGPDTGGTAAWGFTALQVWLAGGRPLRIRPRRPRDPSRLDGLIVGGGADVDPQTYTEGQVLAEYLREPPVSSHLPWYRRMGQWVRGLMYPLVFLLRKWLSRSQVSRDEARDRLELYLLHEAQTRQLPVLGICRGAQLINVYHGGNLHEDIGSFYYEEPNPRSIFPIKEVLVKPGSRLARILGVELLEVNALHHQAVNQTGEAIDVVAQERNQVTQGIEQQAERFVLGVQWHPEFLPHLPRQRWLFEAMVRAAEQRLRQPKRTDADAPVPD